MITPEEAADYEIRTSLWAPYCNWEWAQTLMAWYYAGKVNRRFARWYRRERRMKFLRAILASEWNKKS